MYTLLDPDGKFLDNISNEQTDNLLRSYALEGRAVSIAPRSWQLILPTGYRIASNFVWGSAVWQDLKERGRNQILRAKAEADIAALSGSGR